MDIVVRGFEVILGELGLYLRSWIFLVSCLGEFLDFCFVVIFWIIRF